jgi:hypothetical protein
MVVRLSGTEISGSSYSVVVDPISSEPVSCIFTSNPSTTIAGEVYTVTIQSRDIYNNNGIYTTSDSYRISFTRSDGGGPEQLTTTAVHQSAGVYRA